MRGHFASWAEPRTVLIGVFVLAFAFAEGVGNDWIAVAVIDGYDAPEAVGTLVFAMFLAAMTLGRWFGPALLDRYGRTRVVRPMALIGIAGTLLFVFAPVTWLALVGAVLWGLGTSLGFPVGMSAGADDPALAAGRVSVISTIGYCAFLVGPPLIGLLGDHSSVLRALLAVAALLALAVLLASVVEPPDSPAADRSQLTPGNLARVVWSPSRWVPLDDDIRRTRQATRRTAGAGVHVDGRHRFGRQPSSSFGRSRSHGATGRSSRSCSIRMRTGSGRSTMATGCA